MKKVTVFLVAGALAVSGLVLPVDARVRDLSISGAVKNIDSSSASVDVQLTALDVDGDALPSSYSSVDKGYVTPVRNQGNTQSCWAISGVAAVESILAKDGLADNTEASYLSPAHMDAWGSTREDNTGWQRDYEKSGGYSYISMAYLASRSGAVPEAVMPFGSLQSLFRPVEAEDIQYGVNGIMYVEGSDRSTVKKCIIDNASVVANFSTHTKFYTDNNTNYYCPQMPSKVSGHSICIVGWDDDYDKENFTVKDTVQPTAEDRENGITKPYQKSFTPENNGAWLCKNSWGKNNSIEGMFWISYEDKTIFSEKFAPTFCITDYEKISDFKHIYQNEIYGAVIEFDFLASMGYDELTYINTFDFSREGEYLDKVMFETQGIGNDYTIYYIPVDADGKTPVTDTALWQKVATGTVDYSGYITVETEKLALNGTKAAIGVKLTDKTGAKQNAVGVDEWLDNLSGDRLFTPDPQWEKSYIFYDGKMQDVKDYYKKAENDDIGGNLVVKAMTTESLLTLKGDADNNGAVNIADASAVQRHVVHLTELTAVGRANADFDGDGRITIRDCTAIQKHLAGLNQ